jgi:hypothetical protein
VGENQAASDNGKPAVGDIPESSAVVDGTARIEAVPLREPRINPAAFAVDWDTEAYADEEDEGVDAKWARPPKDQYVRAHPTWTAGVYLLDCRESRGFEAEYILSRDVARLLIDEDEPPAATRIYLLADRDGGWRYWPVKQGDPTEQKKPDHVKTAELAIGRARDEWVKITWRSKKGGNGWRARKARVEIPEPEWPADPMTLFLEVIKDRYIEDPDDDVILKYLGRA